MSEGGVTRRLAAIVAADVAGYSRLIGADEEATFTALRAHRAELIDPKIAQYRGRIANTAGDSMLIEFPSVVEALRCAVDLQRGMRERNAEVTDERRIEFRIGINLGDIIEQDGDLLGDGVNVAARIEGLAEPGGICVSDDAFRQIRDRVSVDFEDLGDVEVKNIARPVRVFRVLAEGAVVPTPQGRRLNKPLFATATVIVLLTVLGGGVWWWLTQQESHPATDLPEAVSGSPQGPALALPDKPSIAVLPFQNMSGDPQQNYFAEGMAEDIITDLAKISGLFVIARNSSFQYGDKAVNVKQVGRELGIKYILEGSVRRAGDRVRINAQLIDAQSGAHLWAERYDGTLRDVFALQDKVTEAVVKALVGKLEQNEKTTISQNETDNIEAYDEFLAGWALYSKTTPDNFKSAIKHFERAISLDPNYVRPHAALAALYSTSYRNFWHVSLGYERGPTGHAAIRQKRDDHLKKALERPNALALAVEARRRVETWQFDKAQAIAVRAIALAPGAPDGHLALGWVLTMSGEAEEAIRQIKTAMRLEPHYPWSYPADIGAAYLIGRQYTEAIKYLEEATRLNPESEFHLAMLSCAYEYAGHHEIAKITYEKWEKVTHSHGQPFFGAHTVDLRWQFKKESDRNFIFNRLNNVVPSAEWRQ